MKKIALFLTAVLCLTLCLMILASAEGNTEEPAPESEGFRYRLLEDGTAEILAYTGKELTLVLPETLDGCPVTSIGNEAFYNYRYSMEDLTIPASVTHIGSYAFSMTDLEEIEIPAGVVSMGDNPFGYCTSLKTITVAEENPVFYMEDGVLFCRDDHSLVCFPNLLADPYEDGDEDDYEPVTYKVPAGTEIIRGGAFGGVECLSEILLPDSLRVIGSQAFGFCWSLDSLIIPDSVTEIGDTAFDTCKYLSRVVLPAGLKRIPPCCSTNAKACTKPISRKVLRRLGTPHSVFAAAWKRSGFRTACSPSVNTLSSPAQKTWWSSAARTAVRSHTASRTALNFW